jgi:hypothetical protein
MASKKYSINWEDDEPVSFEVDGVVYDSLDEVPDARDRDQLGAMLDSSLDQQFEEQFRDFDREFQKDWEAHKKTSAKAEKIIMGVFTGIAALMLLIASVSAVNAILKIAREERATGRVIEIVERREYVNEQDRIVQDYYYPVVEYVSADGRFHMVHMSEGSSTPSHEVGDEVTVLYNPEHPLEARIQSVGSYALMWLLPGITGILGLAFLGGVILVRNVMSPSEDSPHEQLV